MNKIHKHLLFVFILVVSAIMAVIKAYCDLPLIIRLGRRFAIKPSTDARLIIGVVQSPIMRGEI